VAAESASTVFRYAPLIRRGRFVFATSRKRFGRGGGEVRVRCRLAGGKDVAWVVDCVCSWQSHQTLLGKDGRKTKHSFDHLARCTVGYATVR
jgi:hypothetical protein